VSKILALIYN